MTREEKQKAIDALKISAPVRAMTEEEFNDYIQTINQIMDWLEQELCEDKYIKVPKKTLKYRTTGMVAYNVDWLKAHFDLERAVICGEQESCDDVLDKIRNEIDTLLKVYPFIDHYNMYVKLDDVKKIIDKYIEREG